MDLDSAYIEPLVDDWLDGLQEITKEEEAIVKAGEEFYMPFVALPVPIINAIFQITEHLALGADIKYVTIHLYDKFMCNYFWDVYRAKRTLEEQEDSWMEICRQISAHSKLRIASCLQLASKMDSHHKGLTVSQVLDLLRWFDKKNEYTANAVISSEFKVFKMIGFKIPLYTPLHCIEVLLAMTGLGQTPSVHDISISLLDVAYLQRNKVYSQLQCLVQKHVVRTEREKRNAMTLESNALFLSAAIILCSTFFLCVEDATAKNIALQLAELVDIQDSDIWDMANILLVVAIQK